MTRTTTSLAPPGANGTTMVTGLSGKRARAVVVDRTRIPTNAANRVPMLFMFTHLKLRPRYNICPMTTIDAANLDGAERYAIQQRMRQQRMRGCASFWF